MCALQETFQNLKYSTKAQTGLPDAHKSKKQFVYLVSEYLRDVIKEGQRGKLPET